MTAPQAKGWTAERRQLQAARIRMQKPWLHSTGPRTVKGKARSSRNAFKHGRRSAEYIGRMKDIYRFLRVQRKYLVLVRQEIRLRERLLRLDNAPVYGHFASGGSDMRMASVFPPVISPKRVPRSCSRLNSA